MLIICFSGRKNKKKGKIEKEMEEIEMKNNYFENSFWSLFLNGKKCDIL